MYSYEKAVTADVYNYLINNHDLTSYVYHNDFNNNAVYLEKMFESLYKQPEWEDEYEDIKRHLSHDTVLVNKVIRDSMNGDHLNVVELLFSDSGIRSVDMYCKTSVLPKAVRKALTLWEDIKSLSAYMEMNNTGQRKIDEINELREMAAIPDSENPF